VYTFMANEFTLRQICSTINFSTMTFTTTTAEHLLYENAFFAIEVLGGIRLEGLDRMRVTLKVAQTESEVPPLRHNLDVYNDTQLEKFIRKIAERFEIGTSTVAGTLSELTQQLENYRLQQIRANSDELVAKSKPLTTVQKEQAIKTLMADGLLLLTIKDLQLSGIQGEEENALILYLAMTSRKMQDPISVVCLAKSGTGKSYLMERVALCIPLEDQKEHTQFTGNAFYYYKREEIRNKVFLIEDLAGALNALFPIRELQSKKRISKTVTRKGREGKLETVTLVVEGPVSVIAVTTEESIYEDNANRSILIYLNDSKEQDEKVMNYQKNKRAGLINVYEEQQIQEKLQHIQKVLAPIKVINPFAPHIDLPENFPKKRRALPILLNFIEAITFYHQYQREQKTEKETGEVFIESTIEDIQNGYEYLKTVLLRRSDELNGAVRNFYEQLKVVLEKNELLKFKVAAIKSEIKLTPRSIQNYLKELAEYYFVQVTGGKQRTGYEYELIPSMAQSELEKQIDLHIQQVLQRIANTLPKPKSKRNAKECENEALRIETPAA
jgi:hypothetical protein